MQLFSMKNKTTFKMYDVIQSRVEFIFPMKDRKELPELLENEMLIIDTILFSREENIKDNIEFRIAGKVPYIFYRHCYPTVNYKGKEKGEIKLTTPIVIFSYCSWSLTCSLDTELIALGTLEQKYE